MKRAPLPSRHTRSLACLAIALLAALRLCPCTALPLLKDPPAAADPANATAAAATTTVFDLLEEHGLPRGLVPDTVTSYSLDAGGAFVVDLAEPCYASIPSGILIFYGRQLSGVLGDGQLAQLKGISAKSLFVWVQVRSIYVDNPASGSIHFRTSLVQQTLPVAEFLKSPACLASTAGAAPRDSAGWAQLLSRHREGLLDVLRQLCPRLWQILSGRQQSGGA